MTAPAIEGIYDKLFNLVEAIVPSVSPQKPFKRISDNIRLEDLPLNQCERTFDMMMTALTDQSAEVRGKQTPGVADRTMGLELGVAYPNPLNALAIAKEVASDAELIFRAVEKLANWAGVPIRRVVPRLAAVDDGYQDGSMLILRVLLEIQYLDTE